MSKTIWLGAVAYNPKVVTIWEGMRRYFHDEAHLPVEVVLFQSYDAQVIALLAEPGDPSPRIDIAWNTNLAYLQADEWSGHACRAIAMRDTDLGWMTKIVAVTGGSISTLVDLKNRTLALGSRDSGHAAILPVHFLQQQGMQEAGTTAPFVSTAMWAYMVIPGPAKLKWCVPSSTGEPTPAQSAAPSGTPCAASASYLKAVFVRYGPPLHTITACSRRGPISTSSRSAASPTHSQR